MLKFTFETDEKEITLVSIKIEYKNKGLLQKAIDMLGSVVDDNEEVDNKPTSSINKPEIKLDTKKSNESSNLPPPPEMLRTF